MTHSPTPIVDSFGTPNYPALRAAGVKVAMRYLAGANPLTAGEVARAHAAGVGIGLICERSATAALAGAGAGAASGELYSRLAAALGAPSGVVLWRTVDFDPSTPALATVRAYVGSFSVMVRARRYRSGVYGGEVVCNLCRPEVDLVWQAGGWSNGIDVPAAIRQLVVQETIAGVVFDEDLEIAGDVGAWMPPKPKPAPSPAPSPQPEVEVKDIIAAGSKGGAQVIDSALKSKRPVAEPSVVEALLATGQYLDLRGKLDGAFVDGLPVA